MTDRLLIPFARATCRPLPTPVQFVAENVPDVGWVVGDTGQPLDQLGAFGQLDFDLSELVAA